MLPYKPPVYEYKPPAIEYTPHPDDDDTPCEGDECAQDAFAIGRRHIVVRKRVIWLPLAVLLTTCSVLYITSSKPSYDEPFLRDSLLGGTKAPYVQSLVGDVIEACSRRSSTAEDIESSLDRLRDGLREKYVRVTPGVVIASGCVVAWELFSSSSA